MARLSPPLFKRWRSVLPELASSGATPHREANSASLFSLSGFPPPATARAAAETAPQPFRESQPCGVNIHWGDYGTNKIAAERFLLDNVENLYIIRPPYLYGKMNNLYREAFVFECAENDLPFYVPGSGKMPLQFFDVNDLCRFIDVLLEKKPDQRVFNVGDPNTVTVSEWVRACYAVLGKEPELRNVADHDPQRWFCFRDYAYSLDVSSQQTLMPDLKLLSDGLRESYEWYAAHRGEVRRKDYLSYILDNIEEM